MYEYFLNNKRQIKINYESSYPKVIQTRVKILPDAFRRLIKTRCARAHTHTHTHAHTHTHRCCANHRRSLTESSTTPIVSRCPDIRAIDDRYLKKGGKMKERRTILEARRFEREETSTLTLSVLLPRFHSPICRSKEIRTAGSRSLPRDISLHVTV